MTRALVDLPAAATVLDAADRIAAAPSEGDIALVVPPGAPLLRSAVFLDVVRDLAGGRRVSLVTADARARSLAGSVHLAAYASLAALERHELDPTERLEPARRAHVAARARVTGGGPASRRVLGIVASFAAAAVVLAGVLVPQARVVVSPAVQPLGPVRFDITAGGGGPVTLRTLTGQVANKIRGAATGSRTEEVKAKGAVQLENKTTDEVRVPKGSTFRTGDGVLFASTADVTVPRSVIVPGTPFTLIVGKVSVAIEATVAGTPGNVAAGRITVGQDPRYAVTNPEPTTGGAVKRIAQVTLDDYDATAKRAPDALRAAAEDQLARWVREPRQGEQVVQQVLVRQTSLAPAPTDLVGKDMDSFELTVTGQATAYAVPDSEPRRAALTRLKDAAAVGNDVDERSASVVADSVKIDGTGVMWSVTVEAWQLRRTDRDRAGRLIAGHTLGDARSILEAEGLRLVRVDAVPPWWPIMPVLDGRITVQVEAPPISGRSVMEAERGSGLAGPSGSAGAERPSAARRADGH